MIIATAGHVDHGKTRLVKALTGTDTDTLAEEKKRGLTIDIGFAYLPQEIGQNIGFIDVPGHNRFIRNAICGLAATDFVLLIIAADDGVMPQTEEHLAIVDLLKRKRGAIVISKIDIVPEQQLEVVRQEIDWFVEGTVAADWPVFPASSITGDGIESLLHFLLGQAPVGERPDNHLISRCFRMPVDRVFTLKGLGVIVTGTVFSGCVQTGEILTIAGTGKQIRVRGLRVQNNTSDISSPGQRCAINLAGSEIDKTLIKRGSWIVDEAAGDLVYRFDAEIRILGNAPRALKHWTAVHLHHAASESTARVAVLTSSSILPGEKGLVQIVSDHAIGARFGDSFIIRDQSARVTLGGGNVIDIDPPKRGRARPERVKWLQLSNRDEIETVLQDLVEISTDGIDLNRFAINRNLTEEAMSGLVRKLDLRIVNENGRTIAYGRQFYFQQINSLAVKTKLSLAENADWLEIEKVLDQQGVRGEVVARLADDGLSPKHLSNLLTDGIGQGLIVKLSEKLYMLTRHFVILRDQLKILTRQGDTDKFSLVEFRQITGLGRNRAIEILDCLDRQGITGRVDQLRVLLPAAERRMAQLLKHHQTEGKDRTLVGRPVFKTGGGR